MHLWWRLGSKKPTSIVINNYLPSVTITLPLKSTKADAEINEHMYKFGWNDAMKRASELIKETRTGAYEPLKGEAEHARYLAKLARGEIQFEDDEELL